MSHQNRGDDARVISKHVAPSVGTSRRRAGSKLGDRLKKDIVGEGPTLQGAAFQPRSKQPVPKLQGAAFQPVGGDIRNADQAAAYNASGGKV